MKIKALVNAFPSLQKIAGQDLRAKTLYHVSLLLNRFDKEIEAYENTRINLLEKYGEKDGDMYKIKPECKEIFENEMQELYDTDVNTVYGKIKLPKKVPKNTEGE